MSSPSPNVPMITLAISAAAILGAFSGIGFDVVVSTCKPLGRSSMLLSISFYARSFKEAQSLMGPLNIIILVPLFLSIGPGIEIDHVMALVPLINVGLLTKEIVAGSVEPIYFIETLLSLLFFAAIGVRFSVYWFNKEKTIFRI